MKQLLLVPACIALSSAVLLDASTADANRIKDLVTVEGVRDNPLTGFGIVVGLAGTGDDARSPIIRRSLAKMLKRLGVTVPVSEIKAKNVAAVVITARLPPFARAGQAIDVTVSSMGSSKSLSGGTLLAAPLKGADLATYAIAQGSLSTGGFAISGNSGSKTTKNHVTAGQLPGGATVEAGALTRLPRQRVVLILKEPDATTASRIAESIDKSLGAGTAIVRDHGAVSVAIKGRWRNRVVQLIATLEALEATPDSPAKVIIDERTGTVVVGTHVELGACAIAHGSLTVTVTEQPVVVQPEPVTDGKTVEEPDTQITVTESGGDLKPIGPAATVGDVAASLNALGAKPRDLVSIFQALKRSGALRAQIEIL